MARSRFAMLAPLLALVGLAAVPSSKHVSIRQGLAERRKLALENAHERGVLSFGEADHGFLELSSLLGIVVVIIVAVVALALLAALSPSFLSSIAGIVNIFSSGNFTTGDATADNIMPVFGTLIAFLGLFALVGLVFAVVQLKHSGA